MSAIPLWLLRGFGWPRFVCLIAALLAGCNGNPPNARGASQTAADAGPQTDVSVASRDAGADETSKNYAAVEKLIDELVNVAQQGLGYSITFSGTDFLPYEGTEEMGTLILGAAHRSRSETLRAIVEIGADAVPGLIKHIGDKRATKMKPVAGMDWMDFPDEYDFNRRIRQTAPEGVNRVHDLKNSGGRPASHALTIGDLCFVALGQIVNRHFSAMRYQPTGGLIVNSPTYSESLRKAILTDWAGLSKDVHRSLLIEDFRKPDIDGSAASASFCDSRSTTPTPWKRSFWMNCRNRPLVYLRLKNSSANRSSRFLTRRVGE